MYICINNMNENLRPHALRIIKCLCMCKQMQFMLLKFFCDTFAQLFVFHYLRNRRIHDILHTVFSKYYVCIFSYSLGYCV